VAVVDKFVQKMGKRQLYTKGEIIHKTIPKHIILRIGNNIQNKKSNVKNIKKPK